MFGLRPATLIDLAIIVAFGIGAAWRGYHRRQAYWSRRSWLALSLTVVLGLALSGFALAFSAAVDNRAAWVGAVGSSTRAGWIVAALGALVGGPVLTAVSLAWFALGDPERPFPLLFSRRGTSAPGSPSSEARPPSIRSLDAPPFTDPLDVAPPVEIKRSLH